MFKDIGSYFSMTSGPSQNFVSLLIFQLLYLKMTVCSHFSPISLLSSLTKIGHIFLLV